MKITYYNSTFRFNINEISFYKTDIKAIYSIRYSLKVESQAN